MEVNGTLTEVRFGHGDGVKLWVWDRKIIGCNAAKTIDGSRYCFLCDYHCEAMLEDVTKVAEDHKTWIKSVGILKDWR